jgi:hypothetical protein
MMRGVVVATLLLALAPLSAAAVDDAERYAMSRLRLTTEAARTKGCQLVGSVSDDSVKDLRRKILRLGGDTALLTFGIEDPSKIYAQVYARAAAATARHTSAATGVATTGAAASASEAVGALSARSPAADQASRADRRRAC